MTTRPITHQEKAINDFIEEEAPRDDAQDPSMRHTRKAGQSTTILLYPLHNEIEESEIEAFIKRASLSAPLRIDLLRFQTNNDIDIVDDEYPNHNAYAYCTFTSSSDCWLIKKHLNRKTIKNHKVFITFAAVPRIDLEGITPLIEFGTNYPPITDKKQIYQFLNSYPQNGTLSDDDYRMIRNPKYITSAPGHGRIKGKWFIAYCSPETATKALEFYSGRWYFDTLNSKKRFVIIRYQIDRKKVALDRQQCFYGITDRIILRNIPRTITDNDDILLFLQNNGFDIHKQVLDVRIVHQMVKVAEKFHNLKKRPKNRMKFTPRPGYAVVTLANYALANKAYTNLNHKLIVDDIGVTTGFDSPEMTDPLKKLLKGDTNTVHVSNLPWDATEEQMKDWLSLAAQRYVAGNKHLKKKKEKKEGTKKGKQDENPFIYTDTDAGTYCTRPIKLYIKYREGFSTGRANATFTTNEEATIVVEMLNGKKFGKRKIKINWALPIKDYRFKEQRRLVLSRNRMENKQNTKKKKMNRFNRMNVDKKESVEAKRSNEVESKQEEIKTNVNEDKDDVQDKKRGKKRRQTFKKPLTKKFKMSL